jgi:hypothetical protein
MCQPHQLDLQTSLIDSRSQTHNSGWRIGLLRMISWSVGSGFMARQLLRSLKTFFDSIQSSGGGLSSSLEQAGLSFHRIEIDDCRSGATVNPVRRWWQVTHSLTHLTQAFALLFQ